jgi:hypothetical protein
MAIEQLGLDQREAVQIITDAFQLGMENLREEDLDANRMLAIVAGNVISGVAKAIEENNVRLRAQLRAEGLIG